jgi:hypothetical protein
MTGDHIVGSALLVLLPTLVTPVVIIFPVITPVTESFPSSFFCGDHLLNRAFKLFVGQWVLSAEVLKLLFGSYPHGEIIDDFSFSDIMNLGVKFSKASIVFLEAFVFFLSASSKLHPGGQMSEDTCEVAAKSFLQIIPALN